MKKNKAGIIAVAVFIAFAMAAGKAPCVIVDKIAAVVNGEVITQSEVTWLLLPIYAQYKEEYTGRRLGDKMLEAEDRVLNQLIDDKLILSEAKRQGIEATDKEIEPELQALRDKFETEADFREAMAKENVSLSELRDKFKNEVIKSKLVRKEVGWKVTITPIEVRKYYDDHIDEFATSRKVGALHILIKKDNGRRAKSEARFLIEKIKELIKEGKSFEELVKEYSEGPKAKAGGDLGLIKEGQMRQEIDDVLFSIEVGEVSDIVETPLGYHLFKITQKIPAEAVGFGTAKHEIENLIYKKKIEKNLQKWLRELRKDAYISVK